MYRLKELNGGVSKPKICIKNWEIPDGLVNKQIESINDSSRTSRINSMAIKLNEYFQEQKTSSQNSKAVNQNKEEQKQKLILSHDNSSPTFGENKNIFSQIKVVNPAGNAIINL